MNESKRTLAAAVPAVFVIAMLWVCLYSISVGNRAMKAMQADAHAAQASASGQTHRAGF